jgi:hypothetical protein
MTISWENPQTGQMETIYDYRGFRRQGKSVGREVRKALIRRFGLDLAGNLVIQVRNAPERPGPLVQQFKAHSLCWAWASNGSHEPFRVRCAGIWEAVVIPFSRIKSILMTNGKWPALKDTMMAAIALPASFASRNRRGSGPSTDG